MRLAIDVMGGDNAPIITLNAVNAYLKNNKSDDVTLVLFGDEEIIKNHLTETKNVEIVHTSEVVPMDEKNALSLMRRDRTSSMAMGLVSVKEKTCDGFLTAGPTGPFVAGATLIVKRINGIKKCALCVTSKNIRGEKLIFLDAGANIDVQADHLLQYSKTSTIYAKCTLGIDKPVVGLICNGTEEGKGRELEREAFKLLKEDQDVNFYGNVEPNELFTTTCNILVSDGFTANAVMKTAEGTLKVLGKDLKKEISSSFMAKIGYLFMKKAMKKTFNKFDQSDVGAAILLGIDGAVFKAHGSSDEKEFLSAIYQLEKTVRNKVVEQITETVNQSE